MKINIPNFSIISLIFIISSFFEAYQANPLICWNIINTTVETSNSRLVSLAIVNNDLFAMYDTTLIRKWQLQTGLYSSEMSLYNTSNALVMVQPIPESDIILFKYKDGLVELRDSSQWMRKESFFYINVVGWSKILPIPKTNFIYVLKETQLEKWTTGGEKLSEMKMDNQKLNKQRLFRDLLYIPNSDTIITWSNENYFQFWRKNDDKFIKEVVVNMGIKDSVSCVAYLAEEEGVETLILGTMQGKIKIFNYNLGIIKSTFDAFNGSQISKIQVLDKYFMVMDQNHLMKVYENKKIMREIDLNIHNMVDSQLALDSKGLIFGFGTDQKTIKTWKISFTYKNKCHDTCPKGSFIKDFDCLTCKKNCEECQNNNNCLKCMKNYFLDEGFCVKSCGFFKTEEEDGTCKRRMISLNNAFYAGLLFIGMEIVRKFWKQIKSYIQKHIKDFCKRRCKDSTDSEIALVKKIQELESKLKNSDSYNQELAILLQSNHGSGTILTENTENLVKISNSSCLSFADYASLLPYDDIQYKKTKECRIGRGGFSAVYKADLFGSKYAVKKFSWNFSGESLLDFKNIQNVVNEILIMNSLHHERILKLKAFAFRIKPKKFSVKMVTELMKTDLKKMIHEIELNDAEKIDIALQILHGIRYLHSRKIQHLDLKPQNILISQDLKSIKIADFGISKANCLETKNTDILGTSMAYSSREYVIENKVSPQKSDMWSFGSIVYELFAMKTPWGGARNDEIREFLYNKEDFLKKSKGELPNEIKDVISLCTQHNTENRVTSEEMLKIFPREINGNYLKTLKSKNNVN